MRFFKKLITFVFFITLISAAGIWGYFHCFTDEVKEDLFTVETPSVREISQEIFSSGTIEMKDRIKIGSLVAGTIAQVFVEENQQVEEGQLLAEIDTGKGDTEVLEAQGIYEKSLASLEHQSKVLERQKQLLDEDLTCASKYEEAVYAYKTAEAETKIAEAVLKRKIREYHNSQIYAPSSGIITAVGISKGERVSADPTETILFQIAPDIDKMEAQLLIDEKDIGQIAPGQNVRMIVDTYPNKIFNSEIHSVSFSPKEIKGENSHYFTAKVLLDNYNKLLRPGMSVTSTIEAFPSKKCSSLTARAFFIRQENLKHAAEILQFGIKPLNKSEKLQLLHTNPNKTYQFVWVIREQIFVEIPVEIGVTDHIYYEIKSGINEADQIVVDILEEDKMHKLYSQLFG